MEIQRFSIKRRTQLKSHIPLLVTMCDYFTPLNTWMEERMTNVSDVLYAVKENTILGYALLDKKDGFLELELICVGPEGRVMKGIGKKLMEATEQIAKDYGFPEIQLDAQLKAEGFYKQLGYTTMERTEEGIRMKKALSFGE
jgi:ribosomal protein S18 acetylase RimI-like enzyme